jgi:putative transcriptional regulator
MSTDSASIDLTNHFLIAMPGLEDGFFGGSVVFLCEHTDKGALGLVINRPSELVLPELLERIDLGCGRDDLQQSQVFIGGPLQTERGFVLHERMGNGDESAYASAMVVGDDLEMTTSKDVLQAISDGAGPKRVFISLGYASWAQGQLESELGENSWLTVKADANIIFDTPSDERYLKAMALLGLEPWMLSPDAGHA